MSLFNTVQAVAACPRCHSLADVTIQFKYGLVRQYDYHLGDTLRWNGGNIGTPGRRSVVVDGVAEIACPKCGFGGNEDWNFYVFVEHDKIVRLHEADGSYDFVAAEHTYIVLLD